MLEYLLILFILILGSAILHGIGLSTLPLLILVLFAAIPTLWAAFSGAPYVPTDPVTVKRMVDMAEIKEGETVIDLGCGDGRLVEEACKRGAYAYGFELSLFLFLIARFWRKTDVRWQNMWKVDVNQADVIFCYLNPRVLIRFEREIWPNLKPGCRVIVNTFPLKNITPSAHHDTVYRYDKL